MEIIALAVTGSTAYGLATPASDVDRIGVCVAPSLGVLSLEGRDLESYSRSSTSPDVCVHELGKFARLALRANPTLLEVLFADRFDTLTPAGALLVDNRFAFLSAPAVKGAYGGYVTSQARRIAGAPEVRARKYARHCTRLLIQCQQLVGSGSLSLDVSAHRDEIWARADQAVLDPAVFEKWVHASVDKLDALASPLPPVPDVDLVNDVVRTIRLRSLISELGWRDLRDLDRGVPTLRRF